jgi:PAS domain S-box-containing protein
MVEIAGLIERVRRARSCSVNGGHAREGSAERLARELDETWEELLTAIDQLRLQNEQLTAAQVQIHSERRRYRTLFDLAPDAYVVTDAGARIREANAVASRLLHATAESLVGKPLIVFVPMEARVTFRQAVARLPQLGVLRDFELRVRPRQSAPLALAATASLLPTLTNGDGAEILWVLRDVSEARSLHAQLSTLLGNLRDRSNHDGCGFP